MQRFKFEYVLTVGIIVAASLVFVVTRYTYTPQPATPLSEAAIHDMIVRTAGGFSVLAAAFVFVVCIEWRELREE